MIVVPVGLLKYSVVVAYMAIIVKKIIIKKSNTFAPIIFLYLRSFRSAPMVSCSKDFTLV